jgi:hypothetical protein
VAGTQVWRVLLPKHIVKQFASAQDLAEGCRVSFQAAEIRFKELGLPIVAAPECARELAEKIRAASSKPSIKEV